MATVQTAIIAELPYTALRDAIFTHPTAAEGLTVLLGRRGCKGDARVRNPTRVRRGRIASQAIKRFVYPCGIAGLTPVTAFGSR